MPIFQGLSLRLQPTFLSPLSTPSQLPASYLLSFPQFHVCNNSPGNSPAFSNSNPACCYRIAFFPMPCILIYRFPVLWFDPDPHIILVLTAVEFVISIFMFFCKVINIRTLSLPPGKRNVCPLEPAVIFRINSCFARITKRMPATGASYSTKWRDARNSQSKFYVLSSPRFQAKRQAARSNLWRLTRFWTNQLSDGFMDLCRRNQLKI